MSEQPEQFISDAEGRQYRLCVVTDNGGLFHVKLKHQDKIVIEASCTLHLDEMELKDIIICDETTCDEFFHQSEKSWLKSLRDIFKARPINYRRRCLGSALLKFVVSKARQKDLRYIYGIFLKKDVANEPNLTQWYQKHGFSIGSATSEDISGAVARVYMDLD